MTRLFYIIAPIATIAVVYGSLMDMASVPAPDIEHVDKAYHGGAYFKLTVAWYFFFYKRFLDKQPMQDLKLLPVYLTFSPAIVIGAAVLCMFIGGSIELIQEWFTEDRTMDAWDLVANTAGIVIAVFVIWLVSFLYQSVISTKAFNKQS